MTAPPPAILIAWCDRQLAWRATAIVVVDGHADAIAGASTSPADTPSGALDALLGRRFGLLHDDQCAPTCVTIVYAEGTSAEGEAAPGETVPR